MYDVSVQTEGKTIDWKIRDQALKISEKLTTRQGGGWGFPTNTPMSFFFSNSADAVETSKKSENKESEKGICFVFPPPATR